MAGLHLAEDPVKVEAVTEGANLMGKGLQLSYIDSEIIINSVSLVKTPKENLCTQET